MTNELGFGLDLSILGTHVCPYKLVFPTFLLGCREGGLCGISKVRVADLSFFI